MIAASLHRGVEDLLRQTADAVILPRFRSLAAGEIVEKSPGEVVTVADREAEALLSRGLLALLPGSTVVGEEATAADDGLRAAISGSERAWLVDPLDGTANFVAGSPHFAVMVALLARGRTVAAWMLQPATGLLAAAEAGAGATIDGQRVRVSEAAPAGPATGAVFTRFLPPDVRAGVDAGRHRLGPILPGLRCAGWEYPAIVAGRQDFALFWRSEPWDHAPGALFLAEAGGRVGRPDGSAYVPGDGRAGLLVARSAAIWDEVAAALSLA
ncbi:fructose-1,6-bisphosphatase/inositol monophosphatase family enzyme [Stella humosa]|uniref:Fructose-1,6-bisphosphatase/inositol monophosphatase family enzyme n=1 Tax=Stella humosa TaxID=94 RepID=A0A3N1L199_9PROT|nr:inositol monophosphatase family protein [Stella humosa]ROP84216.1 fructose-1,6-bisphosphatase/inositol monophosphatase family enzyme [Stella humosa]BBK33728.1 inositol monophosphatase [Stella humosa]